MTLRFCCFILMSCLSVGTLADADKAPHKLRIGVTLHPYYSWVLNIVADKAEVVPVLPEGIDPHAYQPRPDDLQRLGEVDVLVINGLGHDAFIEPMLGAISTDSITLIRPNQNVPLIPGHQAENRLDTGADWNSHSFISVTSAVQQIAQIAEGLGQREPEHALFFQTQARAYSKRLRRLLADGLAMLERVPHLGVKIAAVHDGYAYLFQDLGLRVDVVVQPRHGIDPSPKQLADTVRRLKQAQVGILFTELNYGNNFADLIKQETGVRVYQLNHLSAGAYSKNQFEAAMRQNIEQIITALRDYAG